MQAWNAAERDAFFSMRYNLSRTDLFRNAAEKVEDRIREPPGLADPNRKQKEAPEIRDVLLPQPKRDGYTITTVKLLKDIVLQRVFSQDPRLKDQFKTLLDDLLRMSWDEDQVTGLRSRLEAFRPDEGADPLQRKMWELLKLKGDFVTSPTMSNVAKQRAGDDRILVQAHQLTTRKDAGYDPLFDQLDWTPFTNRTVKDMWAARDRGVNVPDGYQHQLKSHGARFLFDRDHREACYAQSRPMIMWIYEDNGTRTFEDPELAECWLEHMGYESTDIRNFPHLDYVRDPLNGCWQAAADGWSPVLTEIDLRDRQGMGLKDQITPMQAAQAELIKERIEGMKKMTALLNNDRVVENGIDRCNTRRQNNHIAQFERKRRGETPRPGTWRDDAWRRDRNNERWGFSQMGRRSQWDNSGRSSSSTDWPRPSRARRSRSPGTRRDQGEPSSSSTMRTFQ